MYDYDENSDNILEVMEVFFSILLNVSRLIYMLSSFLPLEDRTFSIIFPNHG